MDPIIRYDALVLLIGGDYTVGNIWVTGEVIKHTDLIGLSYGPARKMLLERGWKVINPQNEWRHPIHRLRDFLGFEKHFFITQKVKVVPHTSQYALQSVANDLFLNSNDMFTVLRAEYRNTRLFDDLQSAQRCIERLQLTQVK